MLLRKNWIWQTNHVFEELAYGCWTSNSLASNSLYYTKWRSEACAISLLLKQEFKENKFIQIKIFKRLQFYCQAESDPESLFYGKNWEEVWKCVL